MSSPSPYGPYPPSAPRPAQQQGPGSPHYPVANRPGAMPAFVTAAPAGPPPTPVWTAGTSSSGGGRVTAGIWLAVLGFAALWGASIVLGNVGLNNAAIGFLAALIPLAAVLGAVLWLDRWEPEPRLLLLAALLWGAGVSVVFAYYGNSMVMQIAYVLTGDAQTADTIAAVVSAPIVEESIKGLGVLLIFLIRRGSFDGVVDGIVYAAVVAAGFAFTENILYFGRFVDVLPAIFIQRGIMSPFAHILFTSCTGIALGLASRHRSQLAALWLFPLGLGLAMLLHALWNGSATVAATGDGSEFFFLYLVVQVPMFLAAVGLAVWLRRQESLVIRTRLGEYAQAGWFAPHEVAMLGSLRQRSQAREWAARFGPTAAAAMKDFIARSTSLAFLRQRAVSGRADRRTHTTSQTQLLNEVVAARREFQAAAGARGSSGR